MPYNDMLSYAQMKGIVICDQSWILYQAARRRVLCAGNVAIAKEIANVASQFLSDATSLVVPAYHAADLQES